MNDLKDREEYGYRHKTGSGDIFHILKENARKNRNHPTEAEELLWIYLRGKQLGGKFRRQHPINDFIVDFACVDKHLVVEVDGGYHNEAEQRQDDELRSEILNRQGFYVVRFTNEEVLHDTQNVVDRIKELLDRII